MKPIQQTEIAECGLVCVGMVARYYGLVFDIASLRNQFRISSQGSSLKQLIVISSKLNIAGWALKLPCILNWDMNHFVVLKAMGKNNNTLVGEMGTSLSGGQKQRVILARASYTTKFKHCQGG